MVSPCSLLPRCFVISLLSSKLFAWGWGVGEVVSKSALGFAMLLGSALSALAAFPCSSSARPLMEQVSVLTGSISFPESQGACDLVLQQK